ncbi:blue copper protein [Phtheirospermum japonicum]|uniref:Blue copper protein n=1 Tax=Phtheirospermum japonicum TaxID=374723 RepID=A0A830C5A4_9LAMI|nr:blue copper protein [Phtheirospermum japonicum]
MDKVSSGFMMVLVMICIRIGGVPATTYTVGDTSGWAIGGDYSSWATDKTFAFSTTPVATPWMKLAKATTNPCTTGNSISTDSSGATSVTLKAGPHYFICGVPGHCSGGMKLAVTAAAAAGGAAGAPALPGAATSPTSASTTPAAPTGVATPRSGTLAEPSSSAALSPAAAAFFAVLAVVFKGLIF